ncbi:MAG: lipopolysaccharide assembly protein LapA domain-containing protein [Candidatus Scalinduaceae bacterium]
MKKLKVTIFTILFVLFLVILIQNSQVVTLKLFFWETSMPQIIIIALTMLIGFIFGYIAAKVRSAHHKNMK